MQGDQVIDEGDLRKYRTELPNLIDDSGLDPFEHRLYCHYKRVAGDSGYCNQGTRTVAEHCKMSVGKVSAAKQALAARKLIRIKPGDKTTSTPDTIYITNIWQKNFKTYLPCPPDEQPCSDSEHPVHEQPATCSPDEHPVHHMNKRKNQVKKELDQEETEETNVESDASTAPQDLLKTILAGTGGEQDIHDLIASGVQLSQAKAAQVAFHFWRLHMNAPKAILNPKRQRVLLDRLKDGYSLARIVNAIRGCRLTPFNMGENERHQKYNYLELICRDGGYLERFEATAEADDAIAAHRANEATAQGETVSTSAPVLPDEEINLFAENFLTMQAGGYTLGHLKTKFGGSMSAADWQRVVARMAQMREQGASVPPVPPATMQGEGARAVTS